MSLDKYYDNPSVSVLEDLYNALNSVPLASLPRPTWYERALMTRGVTLDPVGAIADAHQPSVRDLHFCVPLHIVRARIVTTLLLVVGTTALAMDGEAATWRGEDAPAGSSVPQP